MSIGFKLSGPWKRFEKSTNALGSNMRAAAGKVLDDEEAYFRRAVNTTLTRMNGNNGPFGKAKVRMTSIMVTRQDLAVSIAVIVSWEELRKTFAKGSEFWGEIDTSTRRKIFGAFKKYGITKGGGDLSQLTMFDPRPDLESFADEVVARTERRVHASWQKHASKIW